MVCKQSEHWPLKKGYMGINIHTYIYIYIYICVYHKLNEHILLRFQTTLKNVLLSMFIGSWQGWQIEFIDKMCTVTYL